MSVAIIAGIAHLEPRLECFTLDGGDSVCNMVRQCLEECNDSHGGVSVPAK